MTLNSYNNAIGIDIDICIDENIFENCNIILGVIRTILETGKDNINIKLKMEKDSTDYNTKISLISSKLILDRKRIFIKHLREIINKFVTIDYKIRDNEYEDYYSISIYKQINCDKIANFLNKIKNINTSHHNITEEEFKYQQILLDGYKNIFKTKQIDYYDTLKQKHDYIKCYIDIHPTIAEVKVSVKYLSILF